MVLIGGIKYACERCIRGHRVTTCNHTDQPLMMIKPKGRPSSQCKHCKDMRKNKNNHSSGACTCGSRAKKAKETPSTGRQHQQHQHCGCDDGKPCLCHGKRKTESSQSLPHESADKENAKVRQIGMDPLARAKPATESTRTRVGEVSVPLNEYIPSNNHGIGNVNDKLPEGFFQDVPLPFEPGHGLLDLFAGDSGEQQKQQQQQQQDHLSKSSSSVLFNRSSISPDSNTANPIQSPMEGITDFFPYFPISTPSTAPSTATNTISSVSNGVPSSLPQRTNSINSTDSRQVSLTDSLDHSLLSQDLNYHHYDKMIHNPKPKIQHAKDTLFGTFERDLHNHKKNYDGEGTSARSVEVLSLTPTFMDIPSEYKDNHQSSYFDLNKKTEKTKEMFTTADTVLSLPNELNAL